jgi:hypothetical protein
MANSFNRSIHHVVLVYFKNPRIHRSAFRKTGLIPFNPNLVLIKMKKYRALQKPLETPPRRSSPPVLSSSPAINTPPPQLEWINLNTALTIRTRKSGVEYIKQGQIESIKQGSPLTPSVI